MVSLFVGEKDYKSVFDNETIMENIFKFLKEKGFKKVSMSLDKNNYTERHASALKYGFKKLDSIKQNGFEYYNYKKQL